jgi:hypothetical protein
VNGDTSQLRNFAVERSSTKDCTHHPPPNLETNTKIHESARICKRVQGTHNATFFTILLIILQCVHGQFYICLQFYYFITFKLCSTTEHMPALVKILRRQCSLHQGCQMVCFQTKNPNLGKFWRASE